MHSLLDSGPALSGGYGREALIPHIYEGLAFTRLVAGTLRAGSIVIIIIVVIVIIIAAAAAAIIIGHGEGGFFFLVSFSLIGTRYSKPNVHWLNQRGPRAGA